MKRTTNYDELWKKITSGQRDPIDYSKGMTVSEIVEARGRGCQTQLRHKLMEAAKRGDIIRDKAMRDRANNSRVEVTVFRRLDGGPIVEVKR